MDLSNFLTIVIPCKNEKKIIQKTLDLLNYQLDILNVKVVVCDASDDDFTQVELFNRSQKNNDLFELHLINGGLPSVARNNGFKMVDTPYVLFMDSDVYLMDPKVIKRAFFKIHKNNLDLVTTKFRSDNGKFNYIYKTFDILQFISKWSTPFCLGGFMMVRSETFKTLNGFDEEVKVAEDYFFSKQIKSKKFGKISNVVFTPPRRFENKGLFYMVKLFFGSFLNHNNKSYFTEDKNYW